MTLCAFIKTERAAECVNCGERIPMQILPPGIVVSEITARCPSPRGRCEHLGDRTGQVLGKESGTCRKCGGLPECFCNHPDRARTTRTGKAAAGRCTVATKSELWPAVESCAFCPLHSGPG